jgi:hypothetical protein
MPKPTKPNTIKALLLRTSTNDFDGLFVEVVDAPADTAAFVEFVQKHVGGYFEAHGAQLKRKHLTIYVNEEAAINGTDIGFILGKTRPLLGNAVIVESKRGKDVDFTLTPKDIGKNTLLVRLSRNNNTNN